LKGSRSFFQRLGPPRSVILLEFFLTTAAMVGLRFSPRLAVGWYGDRQRSRQQGSRRGGLDRRVAELIVRDLARTSVMRSAAVRFGSVLGSAAYRRPIWGWPSLALAGAAFLAERHFAETRSADRAAKG
jgi:hypothetical protein